MKSNGENNHGETNRVVPLELLVLNEAVVICEKLESAFRHKGDECHNNQGSRTCEDWERMDKFLVASANDIRKVKQDVKNLVAFYPRHESKECSQKHKGKWENGSGYEYEYAYCSECGRMQWTGWDTHKQAEEEIESFASHYRYCPGCGAEMEGGVYVQ